VAKILVADDNSNIQKMVGLALKDQGIDVVAVGNGEAAVRKISEIRPDLVLADVFMPVRNGYEVCQYVKQDASLAHIPVILLVGAFDPLDEQEAQRVGADGVLKKPFVPPDPLISMVKAALARAGVSISAEPKEKSPEAAPKRAADSFPSRAPASAASPTPAQGQDILAPMEAESLVEEVPPKRADLTIAAGDKTLAFGSLLDTPGLTEDVDDSAFVTAKPTEFDTDRNWGVAAEEESEEVPEEEQEEEQTASTPTWRRDAADESHEVEAAKPPKHDWRTVEPATARSAHEIAQATTVKNPADDTADIAPVLSAKPLPSFSGDAWAAAISASTQEKIVSEHRQEASYENIPSAQTVEALQAAEPETSSKTDGWISSPPSPWSVGGQTTGQLASAWDVAANKVAAEPAQQVQEEQATPVDHAPAYAEQASLHVTEEALLESEQAPAASPYAAESHVDPVLEQAGAALQLPSETVNLLQEEIQAAVASQQEEKPAESQNKEERIHEAESASVQSYAEVKESAAEQETLAAETAHEQPKAAPAEPEAAKAPEIDMEALVARVLARMSPEALQAVTREILKPVLETIIRDEINAKKS
jgi:CheY-like chemotaxis protein